MKKAVLTSLALVLSLAGAAAHASSVHKFDPYTDGAIGSSKFDPYTDGSRAGKFDPYDPYDGNGKSQSRFQGDAA